MESINRPELVKEHNLNLLRKQLFTSRQATRQQLSALTGISTVTLGNLLQELLQSGEVREAEKVQPKSGRPAHTYYYNGEYRCGLTLCVRFESGGYVFHAAAIDLYGTALWEEKRPAVCLDRAGALDYLQRLAKQQEPLAAIAVGLPGVGFGEYIHEGAEQFLPLDALEEFQRESKIPVLLENDVNLAAMGYARRYKVGPEETMAYLYLMKGCHAGSAVYLNGRLHLGKGRYAGELPPAPYGVDWPHAETEGTEAVTANLCTAVMPYLGILAPHQMILASDYVVEEHLRILRERVTALLGERYCPEITLAKDFQQDYLEGAKQLALDHINIIKEGIL